MDSLLVLPKHLRTPNPHKAIWYFLAIATACTVIPMVSNKFAQRRGVVPRPIICHSKESKSTKPPPPVTWPEFIHFAMLWSWKDASVGIGHDSEAYPLPANYIYYHDYQDPEHVEITITFDVAPDASSMQITVSTYFYELDQWRTAYCHRPITPGQQYDSIPATAWDVDPSKNELTFSWSTPNPFIETP